MKRIFLVLCVLWSLVSSAQITGYTPQNFSYKWKRGYFDSTSHAFVSGGATPSLRGGYGGAGAAWIDSINHIPYVYSDTWLRLAKYSEIATALTFTQPLLNTAGTISINGLSSYGSSGQVPVSTGSAWNYVAGTISGVSLGSNLNALTATDATLTFSGSYNGSTARTVGINLSNANTWAADQSVPDEAYDATAWNGSVEVPTKNAIRDKIESMGAGYTNLTQFVDQTAWRSFYSNGSGDVTELAFGASGKVLTSNGATSAPTWETPSTVATAVPISGLTAATAGNSINNGNYDQTWAWNGLADADGLSILSSSTAVQGGNQLLTVEFSGANASSDIATISAIIKNVKTGTNSTNTALQLAASGGSANYALVTSAGNVGIGTSTPTSLLHVNGVTQMGTAGSTLGQLLISGNTSGTVTIQPAAAAGTPTLTLPTVTGTISQFTEGTTASSATPSPSGDARENVYDVTALATNPTFAAPSGTAANHNTLLIRIKDDGTSRTLAWNAIYRGGTVLALPTATTISKTMYVYFVYNSADSKWDIVGYTDGI